MGEILGFFLFLLMKRRRNITIKNLELCFPVMEETERLTLARRHFQAYSRALLERGILWWSSEKRLKRLIKIESEITLNDLEMRPTILLCPHFVCLEIPGIALLLNSSSSICSIYSRQKNKVANAALLKGRSRLHHRVKLFSRDRGVKPIIRAMREGFHFLMLPDMDFGMKNSEFIPFFGIQTATLTATARVAAVTNARVVPVVANFLPNYRGWKVVFHAAWENFPGDSIIESTYRMNQFIEDKILETPDEYFWTHRRFKTRPPGEKSVY